MRYLSVLPSEHTSFEDLALFLQKEEGDKFEFEKNLTQLHKKGWLSRAKNTFQMHLVIQEVSKERLTPTIQNCQVLLDFFGPKLTELSDKYPEKQFSFTKYISYIEKLAVIFESQTEAYAHLINNLAVLVSSISGNIENVLKYHTTAIEIRGKVLDQFHPDLATSYNNLAGVY